MPCRRIQPYIYTYVLYIPCTQYRAITGSTDRCIRYVQCLQYKLMCSNTHEYMPLYLNIPCMQYRQYTNTDQYKSIHTNTYTAYHTYHTHQYRQIHTNACTYESWYEIPVHASTNTNWYMQIFKFASRTNASGLFDNQSSRVCSSKFCECPKMLPLHGQSTDLSKFVWTIIFRVKTQSGSA